MSLFPFIDGRTSSISSQDLSIYKEIAWDFENNKPLLVDGDFIIVEKNEALKVWIYKALNTERFRYLIYSWSYGQEFEKLIGLENYPAMVKSEAARYVKETLLINPYIKSVSKVEATSEDEILNLSVSVTTIYGELEVST
jgi:hypothetical protein